MTGLVVYWDIDGTLLSTNRQGIAAWEHAIASVLAAPADLQSYRSAGKTDPAIAAELVELFRTARDADAVEKLLAAYVQALPGAISPSVGGALPGVREVLEAIDATAGYSNALLTGNMRAGAVCKLTAYGLHELFRNFPGGFGDDAVDRGGIGLAARSRMHAEFGTTIAEVVVGDTPSDMACGASLGVPAIGVATGEYRVDDLLAAGASHTLERLAAPNDFIVLLDRVTAATP